MEARTAILITITETNRPTRQAVFPYWSSVGTMFAWLNVSTAHAANEFKVTVAGCELLDCQKQEDSDPSRPIFAWPSLTKNIDTSPGDSRTACGSGRAGRAGAEDSPGSEGATGQDGARFTAAIDVGE